MFIFIMFFAPEIIEGAEVEYEAVAADEAAANAAEDVRMAEGAGGVGENMGETNVGIDQKELDDTMVEYQQQAKDLGINEASTSVMPQEQFHGAQYNDDFVMNESSSITNNQTFTTVPPGDSGFDSVANDNVIRNSYGAGATKGKQAGFFGKTLKMGAEIIGANQIYDGYRKGRQLHN